MPARDVLQNVWDRYLKAAAILKLEDRIVAELTSFKMRLSCDIDATVAGKPVRLKGSRVWHRAPLADFPFKGGNRYREGLTLGALESHAAEMSVKCWLHRLPYGGAKGGVAVDPNKCTPQELMDITKRFVSELDERNAIGPFRDVPAPDMGTNPLIMLWMFDHYSYLHRGNSYNRGVVTGKPVQVENDYVGGIHGRTEATGYGLHQALKALSPECKGTMVIQGFGNVGSYVAKFAKDFRFSVIAVSDEWGAIYNPNGLNIDKLLEYAAAQKPRTVVGFSEGQVISKDEIFTIPCDVLVPAAVEEVVNEENAGKIQAKVILEGANGPTTSTADKILEEKGIIVIPDIYANSGGVVVSYFEWARNTDQTDPRLPQRASEICGPPHIVVESERSVVLKSLSSMMRQAGKEIIERSKRHNISFRTAAHVLALEKAELMRLRRLPDYAARILK